MKAQELFILFLLFAFSGFPILLACGDDDDDDSGDDSPDDDNNTVGDDDDDTGDGWIVLFEDDFEGGDFEIQWSRVYDAQLTDQYAHSGVYSVLITAEGGEGGLQTIAHFDLSSCVIAEIRTWAYFVSLPSSDENYLEIRVENEDERQYFPFEESFPADAWKEVILDISVYCGWADDLSFGLFIRNDWPSVYPGIAVDDVVLSVK